MNMMLEIGPLCSLSEFPVVKRLLGVIRRETDGLRRVELELVGAGGVRPAS